MPPKKKTVTMFFYLPPIFCLTPPLLPLHHLLSHHMSSQCSRIFKSVCLPIFSLCLHIWLSPSPLSLTYSYFLQISVFTFHSPCSFKQPSNSFHSSFFLCFHSHFGVFCLLSSYPLFHPVACPCLFLSSNLLFINLTAYSVSFTYFYVFFFHFLRYYFIATTFMFLYFCLYTIYHCPFFISLAYSFIFSFCTSLSSATDPAVWLSTDFHWEIDVHRLRGVVWRHAHPHHLAQGRAGDRALLRHHYWH